MPKPLQRVQVSLFSTPIGDCGIAWSGDAVVGTRLPDRNSSETLRRLAVRAVGTSGPPTPVIERAIALMCSLLEGEAADLTQIECDFGDINPFARQVYEAVRSIRPGRTETYGAIAQMLGNQRLARDVGQALGRNPLPVIVPCHRVIGSDGKLVGFSAGGGVETKLKMLQIEGAHMGNGPGLFEALPLATKPRA